ncbi:hypothetical protein PVAP13_9NG660850 [Panicum virgatum]|uniref:Uncharacterized protein n=1 Tax=Panicum virgatum TaxID=38727 RepID=A0A8T0N045_PANVG|nr:hypothetical protein PVAP13_9NG660850 [Panicum virgatum]
MGPRVGSYAGPTADRVRRPRDLPPAQGSPPPTQTVSRLPLPRRRSIRTHRHNPPLPAGRRPSIPRIRCPAPTTHRIWGRRPFPRRRSRQQRASSLGPDRRPVFGPPGAPAHGSATVRPHSFSFPGARPSAAVESLPGVDLLQIQSR